MGKAPANPFLKGNTLWQQRKRNGGGRRASEYDIQDILNERIPQADWWEKVLGPQLEKAATGDTKAAELLLHYRFGEPRYQFDGDVTLHGGPSLAEIILALVEAKRQLETEDDSSS